MTFSTLSTGRPNFSGKSEWRYYRMEVWPDLFGRALLVR
jgi:hypothetical protein